MSLSVTSWVHLKIGHYPLELCSKLRGEARVSCLGGLSPGHGERGIGGRRGPGAEPLVKGVKVRSPLEAENCLASGCATEAANLPHSVRTLTLSK